MAISTTLDALRQGQVSVQTQTQPSPVPVQQQTTTQVQLLDVAQPVPTAQQVQVGFDSVAGFEFLQRQGKLFAASTIVPKQFQCNMSNCCLAINMAVRLGMDPLALMQQMFFIQNKPGFSSSFMIAVFNKSGRFTPLKYEFDGREGTDEYKCRAKATEILSGQEFIGPWVSIQMAKSEKWYAHKKTRETGEIIPSKWQTMPDLMLRYRAAAFFIRTTTPELLLGLQTAEELHDVYDTPAEVIPAQAQVVDESIHPLPAQPVKKTRRAAKKVEAAVEQQQPESHTVEVEATSVPEAPVADTQPAPQPVAQPAPQAVQQPTQQPTVQPTPQAAPQPVVQPTPEPAALNLNVQMPAGWQTSTPTTTVPTNINVLFSDLCEDARVDSIAASSVVSHYADAHHVSIEDAKKFFLSSRDAFLNAVQQQRQAS
ncbi:MAG: recombinase RecT [Desulfovibrionaceae bacterium]|nr:recombinase RecT [Desulfovibrionaceae bacterium]